MLNTIPLAERMRPENLDEFLGQNRILAPESMLRSSIANDRIPSMIFWGPPGCGKTSLANIIRRQSSCLFTSLSAVSAGVKDVKEAISAAKENKQTFNQSTILFIDEIHRFNKSQQDALLQAVETGTLVLIGATTENPSFEINNALLSRCQLVLFGPLSPQDLERLIEAALYTHPRGLNRTDLSLTKEVIELLTGQAEGDARFILNQLEWIVATIPAQTAQISLETLKGMDYHKPLRYDKNNDEHYNIISALHKSVRGSDPDAALYWLHRMMQGGEEPRYILRRLMRMAVEDVGNADPMAIQVAAACRACFDFLGPPEGLLALDQLTTYLATAPKSNKIELAAAKADQLVKTHGNLPVPRFLRNAVNKTGRELRYGEGYKYDHDYPNAYAGQDHLPTELKGALLYEPSDQGYEKTIQKRMELLKNQNLSKKD
jgi:putative ATPase